MGGLIAGKKGMIPAGILAQKVLDRGDSSPSPSPAVERSAARPKAKRAASILSPNNEVTSTAPSLRGRATKSKRFLLGE